MLRLGVECLVLPGILIGAQVTHLSLTREYITNLLGHLNNFGNPGVFFRKAGKSDDQEIHNLLQTL